MTTTPPVVLLGHGSPDPRAAAGLRSLARAVARRLPGTDVHAAFLDHDEPGLTALAIELTGDGHTHAVLVPAFLSSAHHVRVDVPRVVAHAEAHTDLRFTVTAALGPDPSLVDAMARSVPPTGPVVLACAGTRDAFAVEQLQGLADEWAAVRGTDVVVAHAAMGSPDVPTAIRDLTRDGEPAPAVASYLLFPGVLGDRIAHAAGGLIATAPIGDDATDAVLLRVQPAAAALAPAAAADAMTSSSRSPWAAETNQAS